MLKIGEHSIFSKLESEDDRNKLEVSPSLPFTIVGIGASAGGLDAFTQLLNALSVDTGMAFVLVQHLDPAHDSQLPEILSRVTKMPVRQAGEAMVIEANSVYVIPPNCNMTIAGKAIHLTPRVPHILNLPIDCLFESLASLQGSNSIGVVLSGNGTDGSLGLKAIKEQGGITFVQLESSAQFGGMPHSALASGAADFTLSPAGIAQELSSISKHPYVARSQQPECEPGEEAEIENIFELVRSLSGVDFSHYKRTTARRRIGRRMVVRRSHDMGEYLAYLKAHPEEIHDLYRDLLISVSHFFRDPASFAALTTFLRASLKSKERCTRFRVWVPGCATGEEAYSLAICLDEIFREESVQPTLQIFGTDISESVLRTARAGYYSEKIAQEVSEERLERYFHRTNGGYEINKTIRECCVFAKQDLTRDPPFSRVDLLSCRNTLIYLDASLQKTALSTFHYSLTEGGLLFLGSAETPGDSSGLFQMLDRKHRIYLRDSNAVPTAVARSARRTEFILPPTSTPLAATTAWRKQTDQLIQERYAPDGVVINQEMTILQVRGRTGYYLESAAVGATRNLLLLAHEGLQQPLREAALHAIAQNIAVRRKGLQFEFQGEMREVNLEIVPLSSASSKERFYFVVLERANATAIAADKDEPLAPRVPETPEEVIFSLKQRVAELTDLLHNLTTNNEAALEEERASSEEISSANEELQSTNEELTTAKEELQSTNEELSTVNEELQNRNREIDSLAGDLTNILAAVDNPILILDRNLHLRRFTPSAESHFLLSQGDLDRRLDEIAAWTCVPALSSIVRKVMDTLSVTTHEMQDGKGCWWSLSARPYSTVDRRAEGAVLTFTNVDSLKRSLETSEQWRNYAEGIVDTIQTPLLVLDGQLHVKSANRTFYQTFSVSQQQAKGKSIYDLGEGEWDTPALRKALGEILPKRETLHDFEVVHDFAVLGRRNLLLNARRLVITDSQLDMVLLAIDDVTERRRLQDDLRSSNDDLQRFAYSAAHDLRAPLRAAMNVSQVLTQGLAGKLDENESSLLALFVQSMERLRKLMEDILTYSGMGNAPQKLQVMPLAESLNIALANLQPNIENSGAKINVAALPTLPVDSTRMAMVFQNLIDNALKYRCADMPRIDIAAVQMGRQWQVSVKDNGQGFRKEDATRAFEPFKRFSDSNVPGSGIGLATCKRIVERLGGRMWVESIRGKGSTFYFTLPAEAAKTAIAQ